MHFGTCKKENKFSPSWISVCNKIFDVFDSVARTAKTCCKHHAFTQLCCFCPCIFLSFCCCCFSSCRRLAHKSNSNLLTGADEEVEVSRVVVLQNLIRPPTKKNSPIFTDKLTTDKNYDLCGINLRSKYTTFKSRDSAI